MTRSPMHIVHIEDDRPLRDILRMSFQAVDATVRMQQFASADEALPYIEQHKHAIDLYILDIRLPGSMNGIEIARKLRADKCPGNIVVTSAFSRPPSKDLLQILNIEFVPKPWHIIEITPRLLQYRLSTTAAFRHENAPSGFSLTDRPIGLA